MSRSNIPEDDRVDFCLYVDEFQNFSTDSFATIMSEARKYHLNLIVANQFTTQLSDEIRDAVFGNMGTIVAFRVGQNDVDSLARYFQPLFDGDDLVRIPNFNTVVRTLIDGVPTQPFSMATLPPLGNYNPKLGEALKQLSAAKYGQPRAVVDADIAERMKTITPPKPSFGSGPAGGLRPSSSPFSQKPTTGPQPGAAKSTSPSFLDDWLAKRRQPSNVPQKAIPAGVRPISGPNPVSGGNAPDTLATDAIKPQESPDITSPAQSIDPEQPTQPPKTSAATEIVVEDNRKSDGVLHVRGHGDNQPQSDNEYSNTIHIDRDGNMSSPKQ